MTEAELATRFKKSPATLRNWRWAGKGPKYRKIGKTIDYPLTEVEAWEEAQTVTPTSKQVA